MTTVYKYRLLCKSTWGIAINLIAESVLLSEDSDPSALHHITRDLKLSIEPAVQPTRTQVMYFTLGLRMVAEPIKMSNRIDGPVLVTVSHLEYNPTDYQPEGLADAIAGWASQEFGFSWPGFTAEFDKHEGRYLFTFEPWQDRIQQAQAKSDPAMLRRTAASRLESARSLLRQGQLSPAAESAGSGVRLALKALAQSSVSSYARAEALDLSNLESAVTLLCRRPSTRKPPVGIGRDMTRICSWYPDFLFDHILSSQRDVEEFLASADRIVDWANAEYTHESVK